MIVLFTIFLAAGLFIAGWQLGHREKIEMAYYAVPMMDERLAHALNKAVMLHLMDSGHYAEVRTMLKAQFNMDVMEVMGLEKNWDASKRETACNLCARMIDYRNEYPSNYISDPALGQVWLDNQVDSYLKKMATSK